MPLKKVVDPRFVKSKDYGEVIEGIEKEGNCPFCPAHFIHHRKPILKKEGVWCITENSWPYDNTALHLLVIGDEHKEHLEELSEQDLLSIMLLVRWAIKEFDVKGGGVAMRFGDTGFTGATVCHLHLHVIVPKEGSTVIFPIG